MRRGQEQDKKVSICAYFKDQKFVLSNAIVHVGKDGKKKRRTAEEQNSYRFLGLREVVY